MFIFIFSPLGEPEHVDMSDSPESTVFYHGDHAGTCFPAMEDIRRLGKLCDVTLIVGKEDIMKDIINFAICRHTYCIKRNDSIYRYRY